MGRPTACTATLFSLLLLGILWTLYPSNPNTSHGHSHPSLMSITSRVSHPLGSRGHIPRGRSLPHDGFARPTNPLPGFDPNPAKGTLNHPSKGLSAGVRVGPHALTSEGRGGLDADEDRPYPWSRMGMWMVLPMMVITGTLMAWRASMGPSRASEGPSMALLAVEGNPNPKSSPNSSQANPTDYGDAPNPTKIRGQPIVSPPPVDSNPNKSNTQASTKTSTQPATDPSARKIRAPPTVSPPTVDGPGLGTIVMVEDVFSTLNPLDWILFPPRPIRVWLPPGYDQNPDTRYPVLYIHDGQNMINDEESWTGRSWKLGPMLTEMIEQGAVRSPILVMIDNNPGGFGPVRSRHLEYGDTPFGERYIQFLCDELKPHIDAEFRTLHTPEDTFAMGSSMGGLISFLAMWRRPDVFGNVACLSPLFQAPQLMDVAFNGHKLRSPKRKIYIDNGGDTDEAKVPLFDLADGFNPGYWWLDTQLQPGVEAMLQLLDMHGVDYKYERIPGGRHNERAWASRAHQPLLYLLASEE